MTLGPHLAGIARDVASGMLFLSSKNVIHRDLAARNCLYVWHTEDELRVKVADLGLSRFACESYLGMLKEKPVRWMPPEAIFENVYSQKSDVWSFGVVLWEIYSYGAEPFPEYAVLGTGGGGGGQQVRALQAEVFKGGKRLPRPQASPSELFDLMLSCWCCDPGERPSFADAHAVLVRHAPPLPTAAGEPQPYARTAPTAAGAGDYARCLPSQAAKSTGTQSCTT
eukprot:TRINITY_DN15528_c0_g1_i1.p1 TRINITY_DN15528_c0_g1~~TRINITY_DN15528_c0_g1_i1.p1  ORF type:complete len:262 (+),score=80.53 TRINITY_DN15528_c0_g1_i1:114-788(+)